MRIYERYFARQIYLTFIFILFAFSGLFFFFDLINELNSVGHGNYKFSYAVLRVALQTPSRFYEIIPVAALISAIYVFAQMAANSEYTIFRVSGLATNQALRSLMKIGIPLVFLTYLIGEVVGPYTDQLSERVRLEALGSAVSSNFASGVWVKDTLTARADGEQATRFVNVGELRRRGRDDQQRAHLRVRFAVSSGQCADREDGQICAAGALAVDRRHRYATDRRRAGRCQTHRCVEPRVSREAGDVT